jgi:hypothetical protein
MGLTAGVRFPACTRYFDLRSVQTDFGAHPTSYPMGTGANVPGREADHSPPSSSEVKNDGAMPPLPTPSSWSGA